MPISFFSVRNIDELDFNKLVRQLPPAGSRGGVRRAYVRAILESYDTLLRYEINTPLRLAHFLGQGLVETGWLKHRVEYMNYGAADLVRVYGRRHFPTDQLAREYERQPERIANYVYRGPRLGNGPPESGDGWRFRGRGFFQLTGRANYRSYGEIAGVDLENDPELIERDLKKSVEVAAAYFHYMRLGAYADANAIEAVSRGVNRGDPTSTVPAHGEANRIRWTNAALDLVKDPQALLARASNDATLRIGAAGDRVRALQQDLADLGYPVGTIDGVFGPATRRALINFQEERRLQMTGEADEATRAALDAEFAPIAVNVPAAQAPIAANSPQLDATPTPPAPEVAPEPDQPAPEPQVDAAPIEPQPEASAEAPATPAPDAASDQAEAAPEPPPEALPSAPVHAAPDGAAPESANGAAGEHAPAPEAASPQASAEAVKQPPQPQA